MKAALLCAFLLWQAVPANDPPVAQPSDLQYERAIQVPSATGQACAILDGQIFPHAAPSLADMRIFPAQPSTTKPHEIPYALTLSEAVTQETQPAQLLNLGNTGGKIAFDLEMPARAYTSVTLQLDPAMENFLATATVTGSNTLHGGTQTALGSFTLFDLTAQHLSRDTALPLAESTFRYLHIVLSFANAPGTSSTNAAARFTPAMVEGADVPPSREAQILYTTVAQTSSITTVGRESHASFNLPARIPVERVSFVLSPSFKGNFSRDIRITAVSDSHDDASGDTRAPLPETITGTILRVHTTEAGREIRSDDLGVPAILGANLQSAAKVQVAIENGDDQPLPIASVRLEMRQRELCFDAASVPTGGLLLYYGNAKLPPPVYDYERLFTASDNPVTAQLGPEIENATYHPPAQPARSFTERHPAVLWLALIAVICTLGLVALKSSRAVGH